MLSFDFLLGYNAVLIFTLLIIGFEDVKKKEVNVFWFGTLIGMSITASLIAELSIETIFIFSFFMLFFSLLFKISKIGEGDILLFFILLYNILLFQNFKGLFIYLTLILIQSFLSFILKEKNFAYTPTLIIAYFLTIVV